MTHPAIETVGLTKRYGSVAAVLDLSVSVEPGTVFGFIGPNGAGKSTTIKLLLDAVRPTSGCAQIFGLDSHRDMIEIHRRTGYLPGELHLPRDLTGTEFLDFLTKLRGVKHPTLRKELTDRFELDPTRPMRNLSTGNKRKIGLVQAFMHRPELVVLDEPTSGIDPLVQHEFHSYLEEFTDAGGTAFLSSHTLSEVERVASYVGIIRSGKLVVQDQIADLKSHLPQKITIRYQSTGHPQQVAKSIQQIAGVIDAQVRATTVEITFDGSVDAILRRCLEAGTVENVTSSAIDLEDLFLPYYQTADLADSQ